MTLLDFTHRATVWQNSADRVFPRTLLVAFFGGCLILVEPVFFWGLHDSSTVIISLPIASSKFSTLQCDSTFLPRYTFEILIETL